MLLRRFAVSLVAARPAVRALPPLRAFATAPRLRLSDDKRYTKSEWKNSLMVEYDEMKRISSAPDDRILLIDVREPDEVALGSIPSAVNLPLSGFEKSLSLDEGDFTRIHGFHKPEKGQQIIFYCRSGKRSTTALDLAKKSGYRAVRNYNGSWLEWSAKDKSED